MKIVILGAGYAGLRAALDLDRLLGEGRRDDSLTLVDQNPYHQLIQELHLTATAAIYSREAIYDLERLLRGRQIGFVQGRVASIAPLARELRLSDGRSLPYDRLAIALGGETNYYGVPGAHEHSLPLRTYDEALRLRDHIVAQFTAAARSADPKQQRTLLTTAIVGGGYTGCQLAGEVAAWADSLCQDTGAPRAEVRVALIDRGALLLKQFGPWASREAEAALDRAGVSVYLNMPVEAVEPQALRVGGGRILRAGTIVWAAGIRAPALLATSGLPTDAGGRAIVDRYLRVQGQSAIFALGDCAAIPDGADATVPATASYAMRQGSHLAETLMAEVEGRAPQAYEPLRLGELVSLGPSYGVGNPLGVPVVGLPALIMKKGVEQYYRATIEP